MPIMMNAREVSDFLDAEFPQIHAVGRIYSVESISHMGSVVLQAYHPSKLRPGGTISGPAMMELTDLAMYAAILGNIGPKALAVTTNLNFDFMRKPEPNDLLGECEILKLGKKLIVCRVILKSVGSSDICCHATGTYSVPPTSS